MLIALLRLRSNGDIADTKISSNMEAYCSAVTTLVPVAQNTLQWRSVRHCTCNVVPYNEDPSVVVIVAII